MRAFRGFFNMLLTTPEPLRDFGILRNHLPSPTPLLAQEVRDWPKVTNMTVWSLPTLWRLEFRKRRDFSCLLICASA